MSNTIELQLEKSCMLIAGLRKNLSLLADKGITESMLDNMESDIQNLESQNRECNAARAALSERVKAMNNKFNDLKETYFSTKRIIKNNYPQEVWNRFGVEDKR
ncbi:MAG: hypothetical protein SPE53_07210 [Prevotella sp.]|nr:hypothetical protein [Paraprevotella sp.]MDD5855719.1 hypothetical protein [Prevotella sp.]MDD7692462.1 hypothetical protein [Prevotella sp.]MDY4408898.1 hypothetical protein [Prevotella sp.]